MQNKRNAKEFLERTYFFREFPSNKRIIFFFPNYFFPLKNIKYY